MRKNKPNNLADKAMQNFFFDLVASPFALFFVLFHSGVLALCVVKFIDYKVTKREMAKLNDKSNFTVTTIRIHYEKI